MFHFSRFNTFPILQINREPPLTTKERAKALEAEKNVIIYRLEEAEDAEETAKSDWALIIKLVEEMYFEVSRIDGPSDHDFDQERRSRPLMVKTTSIASRDALLESLRTHNLDARPEVVYHEEVRGYFYMLRVFIYLRSEQRDPGPVSCQPYTGQHSLSPQYEYMQCFIFQGSILFRSFRLIGSFH